MSHRDAIGAPACRWVWRIVPRIAVLALIVGMVGWLAVSPARANEPFVRAVSTSNVSDTSFTVTWITAQPLPGSGSVVYGAGPALAPPDGALAEAPLISGARGDVHQATVVGLQAATTYYFAVSIAGTRYTDNGAAYSVRTAATSSNPPPSRRASGKVLQADQQSPAAGVIVRATIYDPTGLNGSVSTSAPLSTLTDAQGNWTLNLNPRVPNGAAYFQFQTQSPPNAASDVLQVSVSGGMLGDAPMVSQILTFDGAGALSVPQPLTLMAATPTPTPGSPSPSASGVVTPTTTAATFPTATSAVTPTASPTPTVTTSPTATASPSSSATRIPSPTMTSTLPGPAIPLAPPPTIPRIPSDSSVPRLVKPTVERALPSTPALPVVRSSQGPVPTIPPPPAPTAPRATALVLAFPYEPATTATALGTPSPPTPTVTAAPVAPPTNRPLDPFGRIIGVVLSGMSFIGIGATLLVVGMIHQSRRG